MKILVLAFILLTGCSTTMRISREPAVQGGVDGAIYVIQEAYGFDTCFVVDTIGTELLLKCKK